MYGYEEKPLEIVQLKMLLDYSVIIYVAFSSAPFVRTSRLQIRKPKLNYTWQTVDLERLGEN